MVTAMLMQPIAGYADKLATCDDTSSPRMDGASTQIASGSSQGRQGVVHNDVSSSWHHNLGAEIAEKDADLQKFQFAVEQPLLTADQLFESVDDDLFEAMGGLRDQVDELMQAARFAAQTRMNCAQHLLVVVLPRFEQAVLEEKERYQLELLDRQQEAVYHLKSAAKGARMCYINVLETANYLGTCAELVLDHEETMPSTSYNKSRVDRLRRGIEALDQIQRVLSDPNDFWLALHIMELDIGGLEHLFRHFAQNKDISCRQAVCVSIRNALQNLLQNYLMPFEQSEPIEAPEKPENLENVQILARFSC